MGSTSQKGHGIDQQNQSKQVEECSIVEKMNEKLSNTVNNINLNTQKIIPLRSRYGRAVKNVNHTDEKSVSKNSKMPKHTKSTENKLSTAVESIGNKNDNVENGVLKTVVDEVDVPNENLSAVEITEVKKKNRQESEKCQWKVGQLGWAQVSTFPYWPCIITLDPTINQHTKLQIIGKGTVNMIHVQYFGDNGRHNWVSEMSLIKFVGIVDFKKQATEWNNMPPGVKKKESKKTAGYSMKAWTNKKWITAVDEAEELLPMIENERLKVLQPKRKRRKQSKLNEPVSKKAKLDVEKNDKKNIDDDVKSIISLDGDIPPTPPSSHKDSSDESVIIHKIKIKRKKKPEKPPSFDLYYERTKEAVANISPDSTPEDIRTYLVKSWENMSERARRKYIPRRKYELKHSSKYCKTTFSKGFSTKQSRRKPKAHKVNEIVSALDTVKKTRAPNLFRGTKSERVCQICEQTGNLTRCKGPCYSYFHLKCVKPGEPESECSADEAIPDDDTNKTETETITIDDDKKDEIDESFKCIDCLSGVAPACFVCNERDDERIRCSVMACGKHYHALCLKLWPQSLLQGVRLTCPYHSCHTCISDNPQVGHMRTSHEKIVRCVRCPSTYHASSKCLPAGSEILTGSQIICPKHFKAPHPPLNAAWCFLCTRGGSLICCDTCPTSFHPECLGINAPDGAFICEDCETGRLPLYGEIVWVKLGNYRWWPSRICFPHEIPNNIQAVSHKPGEFCVMFLGTLNYYWVHRGRVFLYQDGDSNVKSSVNKSNVDGAFVQALREANELHQRFKRKRKDEESRALKPPYYVKLKVNKPVGNVKHMEVESIVACECDARWENPCAPDSDCLNRILSIECSPGICPAGARCNNQSFVRREYPAMEPFHTQGRGWGLRSLEAIKSGQFVIEYVGEVIDEAEYKRRINRKKELRNENYYFLTIDVFRTIDAEPKGNLSRFMNHSCQPNCETQKWTVNGDTRIGLFAIRDIDVGEELTFNYNLASDGETRKPCLCGAPNCSGYIGLKAQKPQLTPIQPTKVANGQAANHDKSEKVQKRRSKIFKCWRCKEDILGADELIECGLKSCSKKYHKRCVKRRRSRFRCPWHHCIDCNKRTSGHCLFCSTAYCQAHIDGKLTEYKGDRVTPGFVCKIHEDVEDVDSQKSLSPEDEKEESDNDIEPDRESLLADSDSVIPESLPEESSPSDSAIEVQTIIDESEELQKEDAEDTKKIPDKQLPSNKSAPNIVRKSSKRLLDKKFRNEEKIRTLRSLTTNQLKQIISDEVSS
ncbi:hypothetical protein PV325_013077 [Microctonus aethiopoides]|uniref:Histone-lysine N-methyltransferase NSD2 n=1 Tax=Microctonus aethiopoides TaxID=144406 RepID=A0AA39FJR3_9HYME|nr:hypothetical protein PV325_013077 [Microctonus aethiopoides]KAK0084811.1 hypothetical protein PV326_006141 [Microctonus aethiopoides]KAK0170879.1 hypothetical protein PV328_008670 [Microctonus aethiopoides]